MNTKYEVMSRTEAQELLEQLALKFGTTVPTLDWREVDGVKARSSWHLNKIKLYSNTWMGVRSTLVHEFAHHVAWYRNPRGVLASGHGMTFFRALQDVIKVVSDGDPRFSYNWKCEYPRIRNFRAMEAQSR